MSKYIAVLLLIFVVAKAHSQVGSPYSQFGFGDNEYKGFEQSKAMGGIGIGLRSDRHLNYLNPASYSAFDSLQVLYAIGINSGINYIESGVDNVTKTDTKFGYFALGFKGSKKWGSSLGLLPVSNVNYSYQTAGVTNDSVNINYVFWGTGGLSKIYWSNAFLLTDNLSFGINISYVFGAVNKVSTVLFNNNTDWYKYDNTKIDKQTNFYNIVFDYGLQYTLKLKKQQSIVFGAVYQNKMKLNTKQSIKAGTVDNSATFDESYFKDIHENELISTAIDTSDIKGHMYFPHSFGFGFTFNSKKIITGFDYYRQNWSSIDNNFFDTKFDDLVTYRAGLEYTPNKKSINHYLRRVNYRLGGHFTKSHLEVKNTQLNDFGMSFGIGLPLRNTKTTFNIAFEAGRRGTLSDNLLQETYGILSLNISLSDVWFVKRKFK